ncbi:aminomethyl-transferring glycine dehydrogenase subunit GcvPA, partial [candidate division WOR-3 bacterium]|nr:aminomethyl-transferring glycine dehydrogenase subunit GcvPA [candidate division WOR-3 bacterium]
HFIPSVVNTISSRSEFSTAYTPYQAEVSQGTLQAIFEFQSMICELFCMDVANASMYDGATALAEAAHMAVNINQKREIILFDTIHPHYQKTIKTYTKGNDIIIKTVPYSVKGSIELEKLVKVVSENTSAVLVQHPNFFGILEEMDEIEHIVHKNGALLISAVHPLTLGVIKSPGEYNADIAVSEGQPLGMTQSYGGPLLGLFTAKKEFIRKMPGRIISETVDIEGKRGFVMTLQTREQHIRREKATSNICTNEGLCALRAAVYLSLLGKEGIREVSELIYEKSHYLAQEINKLDGYSLAFPDAPFFLEFVVKTEKPAEEILKKAEKKGVFAGFNLERIRDEWKNLILVAVTEKRTKEEMDRFTNILRSL